MNRPAPQGHNNNAFREVAARVEEMHQVVCGTAAQHYADGLASLVRDNARRTRDLERVTREILEREEAEKQAREARQEQDEKARIKEQTWRRRLVFSTVAASGGGVLLSEVAQGLAKIVLP
jgi:hypothetical protein